jgi:hypothetical protein
MPRLSKIGAACLAAFGFTTGGVTPVTASALIAGGGGGGGNANTSGSGIRMGGGGGAGGLLTTSTLSLNPTLSYTIVVGAGGSGGATMTNGSNSVFNSTITANGGGYGGNALNYGQTGGSGGGGGNNGYQSPAGTSNQGTFSGWTAYGNSGGTGIEAASSSAGGGGGGAGAAGANSSSLTGGNGGVGIASSISGTSTYYSGGGGGGTEGGTNGTGGNGGGGAGASGNGNPGTANTGGGGGGGGHTSGSDGNSYLGGNGGSGVVIISYAGAQQFGGGIVTSVGGNTIHTFTTSGTLSPLSSLSASYLIVAGGGSGGYGYGAGGGAGGMLTGSSLTIDTNSTYLVTVGAGGAFPTTTGNGNNGNNSTFSLVSTASVGGGGGGSGSSAGNSGGSGGGGGANGSNTAGGSGTSGQGNAGGTGNNSVATCAGGGGGAGAVGGNANSASNIAGNGGIGLTSSISGVSNYYAGGGGGYGSTGGTGGSGGGGQGGSTLTTSGTANTGGGGGAYTGAGSGAGGSGIVIISYAGTTQQMAGGTVTIVGGNVIHTFTTSGYLTPLTYFNNSLRFRSGASAYLSRTPTVTSNRQTMTFSFWLKRGILSTAQNIYNATDNVTASSYFYFNSSDVLLYTDQVNSTQLTTTQVFRDPAAWYHIVFAIDTTQATASNRIKLYVNGTQVTSFSTATYPAQNSNTGFNYSSFKNDISSYWTGSGQFFDGYMTNINFIDGQALAPTAFGTFNSYGVWQPVNYGGSYGTNGFFLPFTNNTSTTTLGYDFSPAGNNWTTNNISLTAGSTYDSMTDVPTLTSATAANYAVLNPLNTSGSLSNGNLQWSNNANNGASSTIAPSTGKWYVEFTFSAIGSTTALCGVSNNLTTAAFTGATQTWQLDYASFGKLENASSQTTVATYTTGDIIAVAFDCSIGAATFYKNNTSVGTITNAAFSNVPVMFGLGSGGSPSTTTGTVNFGQQPFTYTPPTGFVGLNTYNM